MDRYYPHFLFHRPEFIFRNPEAPVVRFEHQSAEIYFSHREQSLISLNAAPFGGFLTDRKLVKEDLLACLSKIREWSASNNISQILIRLFPNEYHTEFANLVKEALLEFAFAILYTDVTQLIHVVPGAALNLNTHKRRRLRNSLSQGFQFRSLPLSFMDAAYSLVVQSRENKGYPVTMSLEGLRKMFALFPDEYLIFGVFDQEKMIAASVSIKVSDQILYCFYIGDDLEYRTHSPVTALVSGIYEFCEAKGFAMLDLGLSSDKGIVNAGLYTFKKSFGAVDAPKLTFVNQF